MNRAILFRFHKNIPLCKNRIKILRKLNPNTQIFGMYGGKIKNFNAHKKALSELLDSIYCIPVESAYWKWSNSDLAIRKWYKTVGNKLKWDMLHVVEWDMLLLSPINELYKHITSGVGFTGSMLIRNIKATWDWFNNEQWVNQWTQLINYVKKKYNYNQEPMGGIMGGVCMSRKFIEAYSKIKVPELCHDEVRLRLFSQILGFKIQDTKFVKCRSYSKEIDNIFNADDKEIKLETIKKELKNPRGRRVFHPYYYILSRSKLRLIQFKM